MRRAQSRQPRRPHQLREALDVIVDHAGILAVGKAFGRIRSDASVDLSQGAREWDVDPLNREIVEVRRYSH